MSQGWKKPSSPGNVKKLVGYRGEEERRANGELRKAGAGASGPWALFSVSVTTESH